MVLAICYLHNNLSLKLPSSIGIDAEIQISNNPKNLELSTHVVLPGQGAFKTCMDGIKKFQVWKMS